MITPTYIVTNQAVDLAFYLIDKNGGLYPLPYTGQVEEVCTKDSRKRTELVPVDRNIVQVSTIPEEEGWILLPELEDAGQFDSEDEDWVLLPEKNLQVPQAEQVVYEFWVTTRENESLDSLLTFSSKGLDDSGIKTSIFHGTRNTIGGFIEDSNHIVRMHYFDVKKGLVEVLILIEVMVR